MWSDRWLRNRIQASLVAPPWTSVIGQDARHSVRALWNGRHPRQSLRTIAKEAAKHWLARAGNGKYAMHASNRLMCPAVLRDGSRTVEFLRSNPHWAGVERVDTARGLAEAIGDRMLDALMERGAATVLYTHFAKRTDPQRPFDAYTCERLRALARRAHEREILVTTTSRLLRFCEVRDHIQYHTEQSGGVTRIRLDAVRNPARGEYVPDRDALQGLTFAVRGAERVELCDADGTLVPHVEVTVDSTRFVSIPWKHLAFPTIAA